MFASAAGPAGLDPGTLIIHGRTGLDYFFVPHPEGFWLEIVQDYRPQPRPETESEKNREAGRLETLHQPPATGVSPLASDAESSGGAGGPWIRWWVS